MQKDLCLQKKISLWFIQKMLFLSVFQILSIFADSFEDEITESPSITIALDKVKKIEKNKAYELDSFVVYLDEPFLLTTNIYLDSAVNQQIQIGTPGLDAVSSKSGREGKKIFQLIGSDQGSNGAFSSEFGLHSNQLLLYLKKTLVPKEEGEFKVGPFSAKIDNIDLQRPAIKLHVKQKPLGEKGKECFATLEMQNKKIYLHQPTGVIIKVYAQDGEILQISAPEFTIADFDIKKTSESVESQVIDGRTYNVYIHEYEITPQKVGEHEIPSAEIQYLARNKNESQNMHPAMRDHAFYFNQLFNQMSSIQGFLRTNLEHIQVLEIPTTEKDVHALGSFNSISLTVNKTKVDAQEPVIATLSIEGQGKLDAIFHPQLELAAGCKCYNSKSKISKKNKNVSRKDFEYVLQIDHDGEFTIPEQTFEYFDPETEEYKTLKTKPVKMHVKNGSKSEGNNKKTDSEKKAEPKPEKEVTQNKEFELDVIIAKKLGTTSSIFSCSSKIPWTIFWILFFMILLSFFVFKLKDLAIILFSKKFASKIIQTKIDQALASARCELFFVLIMQFLEMRFGQTFQTIDQITQFLSERKVDDEKVTNFSEFVVLCQSINFGNFKPSLSKATEISKQLKNWIEFLNQI